MDTTMKERKNGNMTHDFLLNFPPEFENSLLRTYMDREM